MGAGSTKLRHFDSVRPVEDEAVGRWGKMTKADMKAAPPVGTDYPKVYVCSPFAGNIERNIQMAIRYCQYVIDKKKQPVASHLLYPQILNDGNEREREMGLAFGLSLLSVCTELWVFETTPGVVSPGMKMEIEYAKRHKIPVVFVNDPEAYGKGKWNPIADYDERRKDPEDEKAEEVDLWL